MATIKETRSVQGFSVIELRGSGEIFLQQNSDPGASESLEIEADELLLPRLTSQVIGDRLILSWETPGWDFLGWIEWMTMPKTARFSITMNQIKGVSINGSGTLNSGPIQTDQLRLSISGSGKMVVEKVESELVSTNVSGSGEYILAGKTRKFENRISGSGKVRAGDLETEETLVSISGSGYAAVSASQVLNVNISGSGEVNYKGNPKISQNISGSGKVVSVS